MPQIGDVTAVLRSDAGPMVQGFDRAARAASGLGRNGGHSLARVQNVMANIAAETAGASGKFNTLIGNVLQFGLGAGMAGTLALGAIAAVGVAIKELGSDTRETEKRMKSLFDLARNGGDMAGAAIGGLKNRIVDIQIELNRRINPDFLGLFKKGTILDIAPTQVPSIFGGKAADKLQDEGRATINVLQGIQFEAKEAAEELSIPLDNALKDLNTTLVQIQPDLNKFFREFVNPVDLAKMKEVWAGWNAELETSRAQMADLNSLFQQLQTPADQFAENVQKIQAALNEGLIGTDTANRMFQNALDRLLEQTTEDSKGAWEGAGEELANAMVHGIMAGLQGGRFSIGGLLKGLAFTALNIAVSRGVSALFSAGAAAGGAGAIVGGSMVESNVPMAPLPSIAAPGGASVTVNVGPAPNPIAMARDAQWMAAFTETARAAQANGFRFVTR